MSEDIRGPWRRLNSRQVYDNPWLEVRHEEVITPGGTNGIYGVVHFKNRAIGILPIDDEQHTWLVRQFRYTINQPCWELPMGGGPLDQSPKMCARRELAEEVGLHAERLDELLRVHVSKSVTDEEAIVFVARGLSYVGAQLEETEADLEVLRLPLAEAVEWALDGRITDVISIAALLKAERWLAAQPAGGV
ncbi:MAG: NUDIX hydrolase [Spongiibacteraceae bacterium]|jgi:8-oxo-dGTP pyrophosphatase MutT (NUDIX family)|nr:NUDIX hydrolase [Spongiibacteraceae bacterium]